MAGGFGSEVCAAGGLAGCASSGSGSSITRTRGEVVGAVAAAGGDGVGTYTTRAGPSRLGQPPTHSTRAQSEESVPRHTILRILPFPGNPSRTPLRATRGSPLRQRPESLPPALIEKRQRPPAFTVLTALSVGRHDAYVRGIRSTAAGCVRLCINLRRVLGPINFRVIVIRGNWIIWIHYEGASAPARC